MHTESVGQGHLYISAGISLSSSLNSRNSFLLEESQDEVDDVTFPPFQVRIRSQVIEGLSVLQDKNIQFSFSFH